MNETTRSYVKRLVEGEINADTQATPQMLGLIALELEEIRAAITEKAIS